MENKGEIEKARELLDDYSSRTGLTSDSGRAEKRYLWTDAFAVQAFYWLHHLTQKSGYKKRAEDLIDLVHEHLGKHHPKDEREGWISGLIAEKGLLHPTVGGLRIGKELPERKKEESYNSQLEWERDGQYFHYNSRWIISLLQAHQETGNEQYAIWALELLLASGEFLYSKNNGSFMYWKMDTELTRPLVASMGAHDPLEGLICSKSVQHALPERSSEVEPLIEKFEEMCRERDWATSDSLGIGGLLLNTLKAVVLNSSGVKLPSSSRASKLFQESLISLKSFERSFSNSQSAERRLAFRECGLSLGIKACCAAEEDFAQAGLNIEELKSYLPLAREIEKFWLDNRGSGTWTGHLNINSITLASSIIAGADPAAFSGKR